MKFKKRFIVIAGIFTLFVLNLTAKSVRQVGKSNIQPPATHSSITFEIKNMGINTGGSISGLSAKIHFIQSNLNSSALEASVDVSTINTHNSSRDEHLRSPDFFDVSRYPKITLKSIAFKHKSGNNYTGTFMLTIKDRSKQIEMPFTFLEKENTVEFKGTFKINRLDFGVGNTSLVLSDEVIIHIDCEEKKPDANPT